MMMMSANLPPRFTASSQFKPKRQGTLPAWELEDDDFTNPATGKKHFLLNSNTLKRSQWDDLFSGKFISISIILHATVAVIAFVLFLLAQYLGWDLSFFDIKTETPKDVEFVIVNNTKPEKPLDPNTKNRSTVTSRSGGEKSPQRQGEEHQVAGASGAKPSPTSPPESSSRPTVIPTPPQPAPAPTEKASPSQKPRKKPRVSSPTPPIAVHSDWAPAPSAPKPKRQPKSTSSATENPIDDDFEPPAPILTKPTKSASSSSSSTASSATKKAVRLGPDQIGSPASRPTPAGSRGQGGRSSYSNPANSGGGKGLAGVDALADFDFGPYMAGVTQRIKRNFIPPAHDSTIKAVVVFVISRTGSVSGVRLLRSSGSSLFDEAALSSVRASAPFRSFPPEASKPSISVEFSFDNFGVSN